jgi:hypothetical protein
MAFPRQALPLPYEGRQSIGFFESLERFYGTNVNGLGLVHLRGPEPSQWGRTISCIVSLIGSGNFISVNPNHGIQIDLRRWVLRPTHYLIQVDVPCIAPMPCWVLEGSVDGVNWICLDERRYTSPPSEGVNVYRCHSDIELRLFRFTRTAPDSTGRWGMVLRRIDFFGEARQVPDAPLVLPGQLFV